MNTALVIILVYLVILCFWLFFMIIALRVAFRSRVMARTVIPVTIIFTLVSFGIVALSVFFLSQVVQLSSTTIISLGGGGF